MENILFHSWESILKIVCITPLAYIAMVLSLRVSGKRTLAKMNIFDFVVTIAFGSILATVVLNHNIPLANAVTAILLLIGFQFALTWLSVRVKSVKTLITSKPTLIFYQGEFLHHAMKKERITVQEIHSAARQYGLSTLDNIDMIIFETTGELAIIKKISDREHSTFEDVEIKLQEE